MLVMAVLMLLTSVLIMAWALSLCAGPKAEFTPHTPFLGSDVDTSDLDTLVKG